MKQTIEFDPHSESLLILDHPCAFIRGKKNDPLLFLAFAFFLMPELDEELAMDIKQYAEGHRNIIEAYMKTREVKPE